MSRPRIVIVGAGFAGYHTARTLSRLSRGHAEIILINVTDYFLYLPLLPEVSVGLLDPRALTVSLQETLPHVRVVLAEVNGVDFKAHRVHYCDAEDRAGSVGYDRLVLAAGSVNKLLPIPGAAQHAHGFRGLPEALYLRDHMTRQFELADLAEDEAERAARSTFVVVGAGYTGTEVAAHGVQYTKVLHKRHPRLANHPPRWLLLDVANRVLPELDQRLSRTADRVLRQRGVEVLTGMSVQQVTSGGVHLSDNTFVPTRSLIWCVGVRPDPLVDDLGLETVRGRLVVDEYLRVPGRPEVYACGDCAAAPDLTRAGQVTAMTAQHAQRQGRRVAHNIAASYGIGKARPYKHNDLGFVVDLGGWQAAADPLGVPLSGVAAKAVTRGYHLASLPGNRIRTATDWLMDAILPRQTVQLGMVRGAEVPLDTKTPELPARIQY
jgi:NADH:ubiquinone reductase (H+-translocating)